MNRQELLKKLSDYFDMGKKKRKKLTKELRILLKKLKQEEKKLIAKCNDRSSGSKQKRVKREIALLHMKRKKGLKALKKLMHA